MNRALLLPILALITSVCHADEFVEEIVVTSSREPTALQSHLGSIAVLDPQVLRRAAHVHVHELLTRVPGVWITRASGQESLLSVRSPVLTGAGSCGAILTLEDGVPTRPGGFCNVNQLFELATELAERIEVIRGPGNALYGSSALHGTFNVLLPDPPGDGFRTAALELGASDFWRIQGAARIAGEAPFVIGGVVADDGGFREDSDYRQIKGYAKKTWTRANSNLTANFSFSDLDQETAGFILGENAYKDPVLRLENLNPEAFRDASSQRMSLRWTRSGSRYDLDVRPYLRHTDMVFLQHFLPGKPLEENGHTSLGVMAFARRETEDRTLVFGIDVDLSDVYLLETQFGPTEGSDFLIETRPQGKHYDYDVLGMSIAAYIQAEFRLSPALSFSTGVRAETTRYDYENNMLTGNARDDGTACGFGGCLYTRPADRSDAFTNLAPKIGALFKVSDTTSAFVNASRGFRAPQMTELYRLQSGQQASDLDSETIDSLEFGLRSSVEGWRADIAAFAMRKKNSVFRDAEGFNVGGGRSQHAGLELSGDFQLHRLLRLSLNGSYARHRYDFDVIAARGESFVSGRDVDTAPRLQGSVELQFGGMGPVETTLQWVSLGSYYLDAENQHSYPGHNLANLQLRSNITDHWSLTARLNNISDRSIADRADFAFGNYRYFPGRGRELYVQLRYHR